MISQCDAKDVEFAGVVGRPLYTCTAMLDERPVWKGCHHVSLCGLSIGCYMLAVPQVPGCSSSKQGGSHAFDWLVAVCKQRWCLHH